MLKERIKKIPIVGPLLSRIKQRLNFLLFPGSTQYWEKNYAVGGTSGEGSYNKFAEFKSEIMNAFVRDNNVQTVLEWGCGDGNQLSYYKFPSYLGFDVSASAVAICRAKYKADPTKQFKMVGDYKGEQAEMAMSMDVIFHLIEDQIFEDYMRRLFGSSTKHIVVYSSDKDDNEGNLAPQVKHRPFTRWVAANAPEWKLVKKIPQRYPYYGDEREGSFADFHFFEKQA
jgi:hypothetical protein